MNRKDKVDNSFQSCYLSKSSQSEAGSSDDSSSCSTSSVDSRSVDSYSKCGSGEENEKNNPSIIIEEIVEESLESDSDSDTWIEEIEKNSLNREFELSHSEIGLDPFCLDIDCEVKDAENIGMKEVLVQEVTMKSQPTLFTKIGSLQNKTDAMKLSIDDNEPLFKDLSKDASAKWGWKDEILLLEKIKEFGLYKWNKIAEKLSSSSKKFSAEDVEYHFKTYYVKGTLGKVWKYQFQKNPIHYIDHTDSEPVHEQATNKYLPELVEPQHLKSIRYMPHREEFEGYPADITESMVSFLDFTPHFKRLCKQQKLDEDVEEAQLAILDNYRRKVRKQTEMLKFMKKYKLIEQFFLNGQTILSWMNKSKKPASCKLEDYFKELLKCARFFKSPHAFYKFFSDCVKERLLKLEIKRLTKMLVESERIPRNPDMNELLKSKAPFFLNAGLLLCSNNSFILQKPRRKKQKFKFTRRKQSR